MANCRGEAECLSTAETDFAGCGVNITISMVNVNLGAAIKAACILPLCM